MLREEKFLEDIRNHLKQIKKIKDAQKDVKKIASNTEIPIGILTDYVTMKIPLEDASDLILYHLAKYYIPTRVKDCYTAKEIKEYDKGLFKINKFKFPYSFKMLEVASDQWIGKINVKELMALRDGQLINYNDQTQRPLERKVHRGIERWQIAINPSAVKAIEESYERDNYIPNTITLNMPEDAEPEYYYDSNNCELVVKHLNHFDIVDGYHRYRAMSKALLKNPDFDYEMELRIVSFSESKAKQFIWQEDQKTKMSKLTSESYNQNDEAVQICERLTSDPMCNLHGLISRNTGIVNTVFLSGAIRYFMFDGEVQTNAKIIAETKELKAKLNVLTENNPELLENTWDMPFTFCTICVLNNCKTTDYMKKIQALIKKASEKADYFWIGDFSRRKATALIKLLS